LRRLAQRSSLAPVLSPCMVGPSTAVRLRTLGLVEGHDVRCPVPFRDGNGYISVGYWPPIPVPARTKFYPSSYPYPYTGRKILPYPYPAGNLYPTGNPYPKSIPENYI